MDYLPVKLLYKEEDKIMKVFYRIKDCNDLLVKEEPFSFYCYAEIEPQKLESVKKKYRLIGDEIDKYAKITMPYSEAKKNIEEGKIKLAEGDVKPEFRYIIDKHGAEEWTKDILPRVFFLDTEFEVSNGILPSWKENDNTFNAITIFDNYTDQFYSWFLIPNNKYDEEEMSELIKERFIKEEIEISNKKREYYFFNTEKQLVNHFHNWMIENIPDIITAWNTPFDIPCLMRKIFDHKGLNGLKKLSPFNKISNRIMFAIENDTDVPFDQIIPGISVIDYIELYKKNTLTGKQSYSLDNIADEEIKQRKVKYSGNLDQLYTDDFVMFCCYNIFDVDLVKKIDDKRKLITIAIDVRNISKCNYEDILKLSHIVDNLFLIEAAKRRNSGNNIVFPNKNYKNKNEVENISTDDIDDEYFESLSNCLNNNENEFKSAFIKINNISKKMKERFLKDAIEENEDKFCGGYVKEPIPGRYAKLYDLDFRAMYPSIIINFNLSPETFIGKVLNYDYLNELRIKKVFNDNSFNFFPETDHMSSISLLKKDKIYIKLKNNNGLEFKNIKDLDTWCKKNKYSILGNGAIFDQKIENAIMPYIVNKLLEDRDLYKKKKIEAKQNGDDTLASGYDTIQNALKTIGNGSFGSISLPIFRLFSLNIAEGITTTGQMIIKSSGYTLNSYLNSISNVKKDYIVYTDTDSMICTCDEFFKDIKIYNKENIDKMIEFAKDSQDYVNTVIAEIANRLFFRYTDRPNMLRVKTEYLAKSALYTSKKHYSMLKIYEDGIYEETLFNVGISLKRSSYNTKTKEFVETILRKILNFDDNGIIELMKEESQNIKKKYTLEELGIPCGIKNIDLYTTTPVHVRAAKIFNKYISKKKIDNIVSGKLRYIYVKGWKNKVDLNREIKKFNVVAWFPETKYIDIISKEIEIDYDKMIDRMIINTIKPFFVAMNWKIPEEEIKSNVNTGFSAFLKK